MNHSKPNPFRASRQRREDEEIHVPKHGVLVEFRRALRGFFIARERDASIEG
jgi:hypothetical protein